MLVLDHLAVGCETLSQGVDWVERQLGVTLQPGGQHPRYGTHNMLLGLCDGLYLELIAINPDAQPQETPRWFGLDHFSGPPRLANWICRADDLDAALRSAPPEVGKARDMARGDLRWQITVPDDGSLPFGGAYPTLMAWGAGVPHPASRLLDSGCRLTGLEVWHPDAPMVPLDDARVSFCTGPAALRATFDTPHGPRVLS